MEFLFVGDLEAHLRRKFEKFPASGKVVTLDPCPENMEGDFTVNCFRFAKFCGNPETAAIECAGFLATHCDVVKVERIKAFVNITLKSQVLFQNTLAQVDKLLASALLPDTDRRKILVEYSAPNTNKPQHLGHVRNNTLGMALSALLRRVGHQVPEINLVNDRGIHICKSMLAYQRFGNNCTPESTGIKGDHLVGDFYVKFNQELTRQLADLRQTKPNLSDKSDEELFLITEIGQAAQKMLRDWEAGDLEVRALWEKMNGWVLAGFDKTYRRMGIDFVHTYFESDTYLLGKDVVADGLERGVFFRREDGAVVCDLGKMGSKVVLRSDGTSVYITQDIGTTLLKHQDYQPDSMIWVVGDEQNLHFAMLFEILAKLGYNWADKLYHLSYGMVNLPSGKMKSREGTVVDADDLFDEMRDLAAIACRERNTDGVSENELLDRAEIIGMGALKFMLLKYNAKTTVLFDPAASIRFEGDTGPYLQYVCARINSIMRKAAERDLKPVADWSILTRTEEKELAKIAYFYPAILQSAAEKRDCSPLTEYLLNLGKSFNRFYRECPVLNADNTALIQARLALAASIHAILADGLSTLTIRVPEAM